MRVLLDLQLVEHLPLLVFLRGSLRVHGGPLLEVGISLVGDRCLLGLVCLSVHFPRPLFKCEFQS